MVGDDRKGLEGGPRQASALHLLALEIGGEVGRGAEREAAAVGLQADAATGVVPDQLVEQLRRVQPARQMGLDGQGVERLLGREQQRLDDPLAQLPAHAARLIVFGDHRLRRTKIGPNGLVWLSSMTPSRASSRLAARWAASAERRRRSSTRSAGR